MKLALAGLKKVPYFVFSTQGVLGRGTTRQVKKHNVKQRLQFLGNPLDSRLIFGSMTRKRYAKKPCVLDDFLRLYTENARTLVDDGFEYGGQQWNVAFIGSLGDWAWHHKAGHLSRSYYCVVKDAKKKIPTTGICHMCPAGMHGYPWEQMALSAEHADAAAPAEAWAVDGALLGLVTYGNCRGKVYRWDVWHGLNIGIGHEFLASAFVEALPLFEGTSIDKRLQSMESDVFRYVKEDLRQPEDNSKWQ